MTRLMMILFSMISVTLMGVGIVIALTIGRVDGPAIIGANAELRERELIKMSRLAETVAEGLRGRGVAEPEATLAAEAGLVVKRVAFQSWTGEPGDTGLAEEMRNALAVLRLLG